LKALCKGKGKVRLGFRFRVWGLGLVEESTVRREGKYVRRATLFKLASPLHARQPSSSSPVPCTLARPLLRSRALTSYRQLRSRSLGRERKRSPSERKRSPRHPGALRLSCGQQFVDPREFFERKAALAEESVKHVKEIFPVAQAARDGYGKYKMAVVRSAQNSPISPTKQPSHTHMAMASTRWL